MEVMLMGYSGRCTIAGYLVNMTSFSISVNTNVIRSSASDRILSKGNDENYYFNRMALNAIRDVPQYDISLSVEPTPQLFKYLMNRLCGSTGEKEFNNDTDFIRKPIPLSFMDKSVGIAYSFDNAYVTSMTVSVSNNAACSINLSFGYYGTTFVMDTIKHDYTAPNDKDREDNGYNGCDLFGESLIPYYAFGVNYPGLFSEEKSGDDASISSGEGLYYGALRDFSFTYSQQITPKYGCTASLDDNAIAPMMLIFGVPDVKYNMSFVMYDPISLDDYSTITSNNAGISGRNVVINYLYDDDRWYNGYEEMTMEQIINHKSSNKQDKEINVLKMYDCYSDSYSPEFVNSGSVNAFSVSGSVYGTIEFYPI